MPNSNITEVYSKMKFQSIDEKKFLPRVLWSVAFSLSSAGQYLVFGSSNLSRDPKWPKCIYKILKNCRVKNRANSLIPFARSATSLGEAHIICDLSQHHLRQRLNLVHLCRKRQWCFRFARNDVALRANDVVPTAQMKKTRTKISVFLEGVARYSLKAKILRQTTYEQARRAFWRVCELTLASRAKSNRTVTSANKRTRPQGSGYFVGRGSKIRTYE